MPNPNDTIRDIILRYLYAVHTKARSPMSAGKGVAELAKYVKVNHSHKQHQVASNLDYLVQKGWVREVVESRTYTTPRGTTQQSSKRTYKIFDVGIDHIETASTYQRKPILHGVNITNIQGVTLIGDGNVVNTNMTDLSRLLEEIRSCVLGSPTIDDRRKLEVGADIDSLQGQLQKPVPSSEVVQALWSTIRNSVIAAGFVELVTKAAHMIAPLLP